MATSKLTLAAVMLVSAALPISVRLAGVGGPGLTPAVPPPSSTADALAPRDVAGTPPAPASLDVTLVEQALDRLLAGGDYQQQLDLRRLMFSLSAEEIPAMQRLLMAAMGKENEALNEVSLALYARWAEMDPLAAVQAAVAVSRSAFGDSALRGAFVTWAYNDLDAAWAWIETSVSDPRLRAVLSGEAIAAIVGIRKNGMEMMARADTVEDRTWRDTLRSKVLRSWVQFEFKGDFLGWASKLPDATERAEWVAHTIEQLGEVRPYAAIEHVPQIEDPDRRAQVAHRILSNWLLKTPDEAFVGFLKHAAGWTPDLFRDAGDILTRHDPAKALETVNGLPAGEARQEFIQGMLAGVSYSDAATILPALSMIGDEELGQGGGLGSFAEAFARQNPRAAAEWITSLSQTSPTRQQANSHFQDVIGRGPVDYLNSSAR